MNLRRRIVATSAALFAVLGLMTVNSTQASAHYDQCKAAGKKFCIWQHHGYDGMFAYSGYSQDYLNDMNDRTTSFWNRTDYNVAIYRDHSYQEGTTWTGDHHWCAEVRPGASTFNIGELHQFEYMNDAISSFKVNAYCTQGADKIFY